MLNKSTLIHTHTFYTLQIHTSLCDCTKSVLLYYKTDKTTKILIYGYWLIKCNNYDILTQLVFKILKINKNTCLVQYKIIKTSNG